MKMFTIEIYDDETIDMLEKIKNEKDITYSDQFRRGLKLLFAELEKKDQGKKIKKHPEVLLRVL